MDLRPKIAAEIVDALLKDQGWNGQPNTNGAEIRQRWIEIALSKIVHHSIDTNIVSFDNNVLIGGAVSGADFAEAFLRKYPELRPILADCQAKVREIWPDAEQVLDIVNDPEGCHTCREGQSLHLEVLRNPPLEEEGELEEGEKLNKWEEWWFAYRHGKNGEKTYNEIFDLFMVWPGFAPEGKKP